jgi:hypothetical protein
MGQKIVLSESFTDLTLPVLYDDAMQTAGTLMLIDFGHSNGAFTGVPTNGALLPNVAWKTANALVAGAPGQSALSASFLTNTVSGDVNTPIKERTPKKGLNIIYSQTTDVSQANNKIQMPAAIFNYLVANLSHSYYHSIWHRVTRAGIAGAPTGGISNIGINTGNTLMAMQYSANSIGAGMVPSGGSGVSLGQAATPGYNTVSNQILQQAVSGITGSLTGWTNAQCLAYLWGSGGPFNQTHIAHSGMLYRYVLEDLTVSGRTYAQAKAADDALWTAAFASGGKFFGDTYTDVTGYP